ncbi:MAG TPA: hypothetical protein PLX89_19590 [Verrucomicrobiota bacterium]|nr:hypothetical protein [Verrucomicrobiota bacterium]
MSSSHHAIFKELESLTFRELQSSDRLVQLMLAKVDLLNLSQFVDHQCGQVSRVFISLVKDVLSDRYQDLSIRAFAHICVALDYFLDPDESIPDATQGGFDDDLQFLVRTETKFKREIDGYKAWRLRIGEPL